VEGAGPSQRSLIGSFANLQTGAEVTWGIAIVGAFLAATVAASGRVLSMEALIKGEYSVSPWPEVTGIAQLGLEASSLVAGLAIAIAWYADRRIRLSPRLPHPAGLPIALAGAFLGIASGAWAVLSTPNVEDFNGLRRIATAYAIHGFGWPLLLVGLGILTFRRKRPLP
jgi:hypothetical protein